MVALHWMLWGATKLCDLKEARTTPELLEAHEQKTGRYENLAQAESLKKLLDTL